MHDEENSDNKHNFTITHGYNRINLEDVHMDENKKISLSKEKETLFITLRAKAMDNISVNSILHDDTAYKILKEVNYDFTKFKKSDYAHIVVRAKQFDEWIIKYIQANKNVTVVYIGCGLDSRITRINPPSTVYWYDLDFPEVIEVRKLFYSNKHRYQMIDSSATDFSWLERIPKGRPTLIIAEGVLEYISPEKGKELFGRMIEYFSHGEIIFDVMNSFAINMGKKKLEKKTGAVCKWAVNDTKEIDLINPKLKKVKELPLMNSIYMRNLPFKSRLIFGLLALVPQIRNAMRLMKYDF